MLHLVHEWESRIQQQVAQRTQHARQCALIGYGQPLDEPLWPVIDRLWALGLATSGSCAGHPQSESSLWSMSYVVFRHQAEDRSRWRRLALAVLECQGFPGVTHQVESGALTIHYTDRGRVSGETKWRQGLQGWIVAIDEAAWQSLSEGETWNAWDGSAQAVPEDIDPARLLTQEWQSYLQEIREHDERDFLVLALGMDAQSVSDLATRMSWPLDDTTTRWARVWDAWRERQSEACHPFGS